jgi:hypothetical protein
MLCESGFSYKLHSQNGTVIIELSIFLVGNNCSIEYLTEKTYCRKRAPYILLPITISVWQMFLQLT